MTSYDADVARFRALVKSESEKLQTLCEQWEALTVASDDSSLSESGT